MADKGAAGTFRPIHARLSSPMADDIDMINEPLKEWINALDQGLADLAAGRVVDGATIHAELRASIERMEQGEHPHRPGW